MNMQYMYRILNASGRDAGEDVLGGPVEENNVYIAIYPEPVDDVARSQLAREALEIAPEDWRDNVHPKELRAGQSTLCLYRISGGKGYYVVTCEGLRSRPRTLS